MAQFAHTFVAVAANGKFSVSCKTLKDAQCIKRLLITSTEVSQADFRKGVTIIKQDTHIIVDGLPNDYLWAHPYVVFEQRGFKFDFEDLPAKETSYVVEGTCDSMAAGVIYLTFIYGDATNHQQAGKV